LSFSGQSFAWLSQLGHLALPEGRARNVLGEIYVSLGGNLEILATARTTPLRGDYLHPPTRTLIEIDESQRFTSARLTSLDLYPEDVRLGFDVEHYRAICRKLRAKSDGYRAAKGARGFGPGGRARQRAYYDALRDLATPAMGHPPLIRIDASQGDGRAAYQAYRDHLQTALQVA
jgi:hypothetical protein